MKESIYCYPEIKEQPRINTETGGLLYSIVSAKDGQVYGGNIVKEFVNNEGFDKPKYLKQTDSFLRKSKDISQIKRVILSCNNPHIKRKVARYIEDAKLDYMEQKEEEWLPYDDLKVNLYENALEEIDIDIPVDEKDIRPTAYFTIINNYAKRDGALIVDGMDSKKGLEEKLNAILGLDVSSIYVSIKHHMENDAWVRKLIRFNDYKLLHIDDMDDSYYELVFNRILDKYSCKLSAKTSTKELVAYIKRVALNDFSEENIEKLIVNALTEAEYRDGNILSLEDFNLIDLDKKTAKERIEELIGLEGPKQVLMDNIALAREASKNPKLKGMHNSMLFIGNPGTCKSTMANLLMDSYKEEGLKGGECILANRSDLVAGYLGQTSLKVEKCFKAARNGILFIEEAGWMMNPRPGDYTCEAVKAIVGFMEQMPDVTCIFALYGSEAKKFLETDAGLSSRISKIVEFKDYSDEELWDIAGYMCREKGYSLMEDCKESILSYLSEKRSEAGECFGNGREVRKLIESCITAHAVRKADESFDENMSINDVNEGIARLGSFKQSKLNYGFATA